MQTCSRVYYEAVEGFLSTPDYSAANWNYRPATALFRNDCSQTEGEEADRGQGRSQPIIHPPYALLCLLITQTRTLSERPRRTQFKWVHSGDGLASRGLRAAAGLSGRIMFMVHCQLRLSQDFWPKQANPPRRRK